LAAERLQVGLLWYDGDPKRDLTSKVERAVSRYREKFGRAPNACYVHEGALERELDWNGVRIVGAPNVLPDHFWVGIAGATKRPGASQAAA
jgi:hypothetical protein